MEPGVVLMIILFVVAPLIEKLIKAGKQPPQPPPQQPRMPQQRPRLESAPRPTSAPRAEDDAADTMLPDDLWEILTGEKRSPRTTEAPEQEEWELDPQDPSTWTPPARHAPPAPTRAEQPLPTRRAEPPAWTDPTWRPSPAGRAEREEISREEVYPVEGYDRPIPVHAPMEVVSLEELTIDDEVRHEAFHTRLLRTEGERAKVPAAAQRVKWTMLRGNDDMRRAIIMNEILGPPKGLE